MYLNRVKRKLTALIVAAILIAVIPFTPCYASDDLDYDLEFLRGLVEFIQSNYVYDVTTDELMEGAMKGLLSGLDEYSSYYTPEEFKELRETTSGNFGGVGIQITEKDGYITVITPLDGTPGARSGIKPGDRIVSVDDENIEGFTTDQAVKLIRGEPGTKVKLGVLREGTQGILYFTITRELIRINPIESEILENNIGYIKITQFNSNTFINISEVLKEFNEKNIQKLIIDIRNNPGGYLDEVVDVLGLFIPKGPIVHIKSKDGSIETHSSNLVVPPDYKMVVLVNEGSASASEIFAGAIQDTKVGTVIGTRTFGKGTVQWVIPLINGGGLKLTVAEYLTPDMRSINGRGVIPDIVVENTEEPKIDLSKIPVLDKSRKPALGTVGLDVLAAEEILEILGYNVEEPDGVFDEMTFEALKKFQGDNGLYSCGILDFTTQDALTKAINEYAQPEPVDKQLEKAMEILNKL